MHHDVYIGINQKKTFRYISRNWREVSIDGFA